MSALAKKTRLIISTIGPYALYGEPVFRACAENGTHYVDVTGEIPYVADMIKKYERTAKASGSIMIPQIGFDSTPPDLVVWSLADSIKKRFSAPTGEVIVALHEITSVIAIVLMQVRWQLTREQFQSFRWNSKYSTLFHGELQSERNQGVIDTICDISCTWAKTS